MQQMSLLKKSMLSTQQKIARLKHINYENSLEFYLHLYKFNAKSSKLIRHLNKMKINILFYYPNLLNYFRFFLIILVILNISKYPKQSFFLAWLAGSVDIIDGVFARTFSQSSKLGAFFDIALDRFTNTVQYFYLASIYSNYWYIFMNVQFIELIRDILFGYLRNYRNLISLIEISRSNKTNKIDFFQEILNQKFRQENMNLNTQKLSTIQGIFTDEPESVWTSYFYFYVWYSSDVFYWLLYFAHFIPNRAVVNKYQILVNQNQSLIYIILKLKEKLNFIDDFIFNKFISNISKYFSFFIFILFALGAFLKTLLNFRALIYIFCEILITESKYLNEINNFR